MKREIEIFGEFIRSKGLRQTAQRMDVLDVFLSIEKHISLDELYKLVKKHNANIGYTTVYRTMKLLSECGLCEEIDFGDGLSRYEHKYAHTHHDHLVCIKCGRLIEVANPAIEEMQDVMAKQHSFTPLRHKLEIFGLCKKCLGR